MPGLHVDRFDERTFVVRVFALTCTLRLFLQRAQMRVVKTHCRKSSTAVLRMTRLQYAKYLKFIKSINEALFFRE